MAKAYWISFLRKVIDPEKLAAYRELVRPAIETAGGRFVANADPAKVYEAGVMGRTVVIEFPSVDDAIAAHDSPAYQEALKALDGGIERDLRIVEGLE